MGGRGSSSGVKKGGGFRTFGSERETYGFFGVGKGGAYDDWYDAATDMEKTEIYNYTDEDYMDINELLRSGKTSNPYINEETVEKMDAAIAKFDLKRGITTFRGSSNTLIGGAKTVEQINAMKGTIVTDKGFMSTTTLKGEEFGGMKYKIRIPKGKGRGVYVDPMSAHQGESEFLLKRNTKFRIAGAEYDEFAETVCILDVID